MESRNPYLVLGIPYGEDRSTAARAYTRALRRVRNGEGSPVTLEDLSWALHEIEQGIADPQSHADYMRLPVVPEAYEVLNADPIVLPRTPPLVRTTNPEPAAHRKRAAELAISEARTAMTELIEKLAPQAAIPERPSSRPVAGTRSTSTKPATTSSKSRIPTGRPGVPRADGPSSHESPWSHASTSAEPIPASVALRVAARFVDWVLVSIFTVLIASGAPAITGSLTYLLFFAYSVVLESVYGQTLGKRLFKLRVTATRGQLQAVDAAKRNALFLVGVIPAIGGFLVLLASVWAVVTAASREANRGFHDDFGETIVVPVQD